MTHGFDLFLTDLGDRYFVAIDSDRGFIAAAAGGEPRDHRGGHAHDYLEVRDRIAEGFKTEVDVHNLPNLLDIEFESDGLERSGATSA